jgi:hypothetical protein
MDSTTDRTFQAQRRFTLRNIFNFPHSSSYLQNEIKKSNKTFDSSQYTRYRQNIEIRRSLAQPKEDYDFQIVNGDYRRIDGFGFNLLLITGLGSTYSPSFYLNQYPTGGVYQVYDAPSTVSIGNIYRDGRINGASEQELHYIGADYADKIDAKVWSVLTGAGTIPSIFIRRAEGNEYRLVNTGFTKTGYFTENITDVFGP